MFIRTRDEYLNIFKQTGYEVIKHTIDKLTYNKEWDKCDMFAAIPLPDFDNVI